MTPHKPGSVNAHSPYVAFKDDRERRWALVSRDIRNVLIALIVVAGGVSPSLWKTLWGLLAG